MLIALKYSVSIYKIRTTKEKKSGVSKE